MKCFDGVAASDVVARSFQVMQFASKDSVYWSALDVRVVTTRCLLLWWWLSLELFLAISVSGVTRIATMSGG